MNGTGDQMGQSVRQRMRREVVVGEKERHPKRRSNDCILDD